MNRFLIAFALLLACTKVAEACSPFYQTYCKNISDAKPSYVFLARVIEKPHAKRAKMVIERQYRGQITNDTVYVSGSPVSVPTPPFTSCDATTYDPVEFFKVGDRFVLCFNNHNVWQANQNAWAQQGDLRVYDLNPLLDQNVIDLKVFNDSVEVVSSTYYGDPNGWLKLHIRDYGYFLENCRLNPCSGCTSIGGPDKICEKKDSLLHFWRPFAIDSWIPSDLNGEWVLSSEKNYTINSENSYLIILKAKSDTVQGTDTLLYVTADSTYQKIFTTVQQLNISIPTSVILNDSIQIYLPATEYDSIKTHPNFLAAGIIRQSEDSVNVSYYQGFGKSILQINKDVCVYDFEINVINPVPLITNVPDKICSFDSVYSLQSNLAVTWNVLGDSGMQVVSADTGSINLKFSQPGTYDIHTRSTRYGKDTSFVITVLPIITMPIIPDTLYEGQLFELNFGGVSPDTLFAQSYLNSTIIQNTDGKYTLDVGYGPVYNTLHVQKGGCHSEKRYFVRRDTVCKNISFGFEKYTYNLCKGEPLVITPSYTIKNSSDYYFNINGSATRYDSVIPLFTDFEGDSVYTIILNDERNRFCKRQFGRNVTVIINNMLSKPILQRLNDSLYIQNYAQNVSYTWYNGKDTVASNKQGIRTSKDGIYKVIAKSNNCSADSSQILMWRINGNTEVCSGNNAYEYRPSYPVPGLIWNVSDIAQENIIASTDTLLKVKFTGPGLYQIFAASQDFGSIQLNVQSDSIPGIPELSIENNQICISNFNNNYTYRWYFNGDSIPFDSACIQPQEGNYTVKAHNKTCTSVISDTLTYHITAVGDISSFTPGLYPNPFHNCLTVDIDGDFTYSIIGLLGTEIIKNAESTGKQLCLEKLPNSVYFIEIKQNDAVYRYRVVKQ